MCHFYVKVLHGSSGNVMIEEDDEESEWETDDEADPDAIDEVSSRPTSSCEINVADCMFVPT